MKYVVKYSVSIFVLSAILFVFNYCQSKEEKQQKQSSINLPYTFITNQFLQKKNAEYIRKLIIHSSKDSVEIIKDSSENYRLKVGYFNSSFEAAGHAFTLLSDTLIDDYQIYKNDSLVADEFSNISFVAKYLDRPSVYNFNLKYKKWNLVWSKWGRKVTGLNYSRNNKTAYITTVLGSGKRAGFPYLLDARLYLFNRVSNEMSLIEKYGKGLQLYTVWDSPEIFKLSFTILDSLKSSSVIQFIDSYDLKGNKLSHEERRFELLTDGFPVPPKPELKFISPNKKFQLIDESDTTGLKLYIYDYITEEKVLVVKGEYEIFNLIWSPRDAFLFLLLRNKKLSDGKELNSKLLVYDTDANEVVKIFENNYYKNFLVHGDLLILDEGYGTKSHILFYNYLKNIIYYTLNFPGGCGINNIPSINGLKDN